MIAGPCVRRACIISPTPRMNLKPLDQESGAKNGLKGAKALSNRAWRSGRAGAKVTLRAALIGAGRIAAEHLACLREMPGVEIAAICDRSKILAEVAASRFGAGAWYNDHRRMLNEVQPHVV